MLMSAGGFSTAGVSAAVGASNDEVCTTGVVCTGEVCTHSWVYTSDVCVAAGGINVDVCTVRLVLLVSVQLAG